MKYLIIPYFLLLALCIQAQDTKPCPCASELQETLDTKLNGQLYYGLDVLTGTEYYISVFLKGDIYLENGEVAVDKQIRYNGRIDGLEYLPPFSRNILLDKYFIKGFCLKLPEGNPKCFSKIKVKESSSDSIQVFAQLLYQNRLALYVTRRYVNDEDVIEYVDGKQVCKKHFNASFVYYFRLPNNKTVGFKRFRKKDLYALFPNRTDEMKKLFKENHQHRFRREEDLIKITEILNNQI